MNTLFYRNGEEDTPECPLCDSGMPRIQVATPDELRRWGEKWKRLHSKMKSDRHRRRRLRHKQRMFGKRR